MSTSRSSSPAARFARKFVVLVFLINVPVICLVAAQDKLEGITHPDYVSHLYLNNHLEKESTEKELALTRTIRRAATLDYGLNDESAEDARVIFEGNSVERRTKESQLPNADEEFDLTEEINEQSLNISQTPFQGFIVCGQEDVSVTQVSAGYLPGGIPIYHVTIMSTCPACALNGIHISCGSWASATVVDPAVFKKVAENDCLVNDGGPLQPLQMIYFEYSNSFSFPMVVKNVFPC